MKKIIVLFALLAQAASLTANAAETKTESKNAVQEKVDASTSSNQIHQGPKSDYEVAALFNMLEKKGFISKDELAKEIHSLDNSQFTDPDPYTSIR